MAAILAVAIATLISMILGELVPKNIALALPRETGKVVIPFQVGFTTVFKPVVWLLNVTANGILRSGRHRAERGAELRPHRRGAHLARSPVGARGQPRQRHRHTARAHPRLLRSDRPGRHDAAAAASRALERTDTAQDVIDLARRTGFSRFPVIDDGIDDVVGLVHIKQAVAVPREKRGDVPVDRARRARHCACPRP